MPIGTAPGDCTATSATRLSPCPAARDLGSGRGTTALPSRGWRGGGDGTTKTTSPNRAGIDLSHCPRSTPYRFREEVARVSGKLLEEASGLAASRTNRGIVWSHNDRNHHHELFAIDSANGDIHSRWELEGAENEDYEDMAIG